MRLIRIRDQKLIADKVEIADSFMSRLIGLVGKKSLSEGTALVLKPCNSIHTFFMRFSIDVVFLDRDNLVIHVIPKMRSYRFSGIVKKAWSAIELPSGSISKHNINIYDVLIKSVD